MFKALASLLFSFLVSMVFAQQQNPFDLKYRSPSVPQPTSPREIPAKDEVDQDTQVFVVPPVSDTGQTGDSNPFDLDTVSSKTITVEPTVIVEPNETSAVKDLVPVIPRKTHKGIQIFLLLLSLLLLIFIVNVERSFVKDLWRVISNENYSSLHLRNQRNTMRQILLLMGYLVFFIQGGIFLNRVLIHFGYEGTLLDNIWTCMLLIMGVYLVRHGVIRYLRWLFNNEKEMTLFGFDVSIFNIMVGLVLLPINVILVFGPESLHKPLIYIGLIAAIVAYLLRQLRWMLTARQLITNSLFLFFVYLCAVEILPLWAISKLFW